ncbi:mRNA export factor GLE1 [Synchiropus picturatus]
MSERRRWETLQALKNSPKGKIRFDPFWSERGEDIMMGCKEVLILSPQSETMLKRLSSLSNQRSSSQGLSSGKSSPGLSEEITDSLSSLAPSSDVSVKNNTLTITVSEQSCRHIVLEPHDDPDVPELSSPSPPPIISLMSPKSMQTTGRILIFEEEQRAKAKMALQRRQELQEKLVAAVASSESEQLKRFEELMELKQRQEFESMRDMMDKETKESLGRQEKLKEEQRHRMKILNLRLREAEQQRLREAELERQRQVEGRERLRNLNTIQEEILQLNQLLEPTASSQLPQESLAAFSCRGNQLCSQVSEVVRKTTKGDFPSMDDMTVAERALHQMRALIRSMQEEVAQAQEEKKKKEQQAEERRKQEELQTQQEAQKEAARAAKEKAQKKGLQTNAELSTLQWLQKLQESSDLCCQSFQQLSSPSNTQTKKLKLELQKAATIPVSQISSNSGSELRKVFEKIDRLLSGQQVSSVSTSQHPQARDFVCYKLAEKFVRQGEEEVASHHEAAFPIAIVASGIWELHPQFGDLFLAHLHKKCPYAVPHYPPMKEGTSVEDYQRLLGYRVDDCGVEGQDSFLKRMSGMIRLYAALIQLRWPYGAKHSEPPHGLNHGWRWLAQTLNMEPLADITATLLYDFLEVCGNALMKLYQAQFWKLLLLLKDEFFPRIEAVTSSGQMGSVMRLKQFLETSLRNRQIRPPKGLLGPEFWRT